MSTYDQEACMVSPERSVEIPAELERLFSDTDYLLDRLSLLEVRLAPVVRPVEPEPAPSDTSARVQLNTEVGLRIETHRGNVQMASRRLDSLIARLEL